MDSSKRKLLIVGAGIGGLVIAKKLALTNKYDITILERGTRDTLSYDLEDDVRQDVFSSDIVSLPPNGYSEKKLWTFITPFNAHQILVSQPPQHKEYSIQRRKFSQHLIDKAVSAGAKILYKTEATSAIIKDDTVIGVTANGKAIYADLVIDNAGLNSLIRHSISSNLGSFKDIDPTDIFYAYRAYYNRNNVPLAKHTNKAYLRPQGAIGISWCIDREKSVDVLIGLISSNDNNNVQKTLSMLKKDNPCLGDTVIQGGKIVQIPLRYPSLQMVTSGYAGIGDCVYMTIPMLGSGIGSSIMAGSILSDVIEKIGSSAFSANVLWEYQVRVFKSFGCDHISIDCMRRWLLTLNPQIINNIVDSGLLNESDIATVSRGDRLSLPTRDKLKRGIKCLKSLDLLLQLNKLLTTMNRGYRLALSIPTNYNVKAITKWKFKMINFMNSLN
ncbi:MAG: NAD(P)/FAD-dependent oxidoreductase [Christensenellaceae bacterium]|jgi:flavin-dependent dehydrogenase|nr:NAD(P)/FAD-dependent oxidoreductase [Christensenellaceae bacterium]